MTANPNRGKDRKPIHPPSKNPRITNSIPSARSTIPASRIPATRLSSSEESSESESALASRKRVPESHSGGGGGGGGGGGRGAEPPTTDGFHPWFMTNTSGIPLFKRPSTRLRSGGERDCRSAWGVRRLGTGCWAASLVPREEGNERCASATVFEPPTGGRGRPGLSSRRGWRGFEWHSATCAIPTARLVLKVAVPTDRVGRVDQRGSHGNRAGIQALDSRWSFFETDW